MRGSRLPVLRDAVLHYSSGKKTKSLLKLKILCEEALIL